MEIFPQEDYYWWSTPLISVNQSGCSQYDDLDLENISVWSIDIGSDKYGNTILWTLSDYGIMGYIIKYTFSGSFGFLSIEVEPINCNFIFLLILLIDSQRFVLIGKIMHKVISRYG